MGTYTYIFELLYAHDCVIFPGLGGFVTNYRPAKVHPVLHTFSPPAKELLFNPRLQANDGVLADYIARKESISYAEALEQLQIQALHINTLVNQSQRFDILNVGSLYKDPEGQLQFEASGELNFLLSSFGLGEFISPAIERDRKIKHFEPRPFIAKETRQDRRLPLGVKKAIFIGVPAAAMITVVVLTAGNIGNLISQTSDLLPRIFNHTPVTENTPVSPAVLAQKAINQGMQQTFHVREISAIAVVDEVQSPDVNGNFCIIGNCFSIEDNAKRYVHDLQLQGFPGAAYLPADSKSLFKAYFGKYASRAEAETALQTIKQQQSSQAWILELN